VDLVKLLRLDPVIVLELSNNGSILRDIDKSCREITGTSDVLGLNVLPASLDGTGPASLPMGVKLQFLEIDVQWKVSE
jgi:hypothetical protein